MNTIDIQKKSFIKRLLFIGSVLSMILFIFALNACDRELDVKTDFPFELEVMPVPKSIVKGETVAIICSTKTEGNYSGVQYKIRYFQFEGAGKLRLGDGKAMITFKPNDSYSLPGKAFKLYYVPETTESHQFDIWISDNKGNERKLSFQFTPKDK